MRSRDRIIASLETLYREAFEAARQSEEDERARQLDFDFQRDQVQLEVLLDIRDLLAHPPASSEPLTPSASDPGTSMSDLIDKAQTLRKLTRFR